MEKWFSPERTARLNQMPVEYELCVSLEWLCKLRWIAGGGVIVATWLIELVLCVDLAAWPLTFIGVGILAYNVLFRWLLNRLTCNLSGANPTAHTQARLQIAADWLAMTLLIHYSGGVESPTVLYFFFHIILATILLSVQEAYLFAILATVLVSVVALFEYVGWLPHRVIPGVLSGRLYANPLYVGGTLFFFISTALVSVYLATRTTARLRKREGEMVTLSQDLQQAYSRLHALYESSQTVSSTLDLQEVLDRLTQSTTKAMEVKACAIRLLDETGMRLCLASTYGLSARYWQKGCLLVDQNPLAREVLAGKTVTIDDVMVSSERLQYPKEAIAEGIRSTLTVPLPGRAGPLGMLRVYCDEVHCFSEEDAAFLLAVASQGGIAIENALAYQTIQDLDEAKRKFILTVTHELRSPVGVVRSLLRTLSGGYAGKLSDLQQDMMARALRRTDFLQTLIDDLLDLASGKTGLRITKKTEFVDLIDLIAQVVERYRTPASEKQIAMTLNMDERTIEGPLCVLATQEEMDRVFTNLVSNAIKYTPEGGDVSITLRQVGQNVHFEITDTGIGIPEEALPHLFEEFYRAPNARAQVKEGTGLGLVVTKDIVTRYGGHIQVDSVAEEGTTFFVTLPLATGEKD